MLADLYHIPTLAITVFACLFVATFALAWAACRASAYYSRQEEELEADARRFNADNARALARRNK